MSHLADNGFDLDWDRFLRTFLLGDSSNVRNLTAHGFTHGIDPLNAAAVIRALAVLALIAPETATCRDAATVKAGLRSEPYRCTTAPEVAATRRCRGRRSVVRVSPRVTHPFSVEAVHPPPCLLLRSAEPTDATELRRP